MIYYAVIDTNVFISALLSKKAFAQKHIQLDEREWRWMKRDAVRTFDYS